MTHLPQHPPKIPIRLFGEDGKLLCQPAGYADGTVQFKTFEIPTLTTVSGQLPDPDELKVIVVQKQPDGNFDVRLIPDQMQKLTTLIMGYEELLVRVVQGDRMRAATSPWSAIMLEEIGHVPGNLIDWEACGAWMDRHIRAGMISLGVAEESDRIGNLSEDEDPGLHVAPM